jgi:hypothetical protein
MIARFSTRHATAALVALALAGIASPVAVQAQTQAPIELPRAAPGALLIAKQIVEIKGIKGVFLPLVRGVVEKARQTFLQANFMWSKDINEISAQMQKDYDPRVSELADATARIYATHFSEAELKDLLTFYQSPLGKKMVAEEPKILDASMTYAGTWADTLSDDVMTRMRAEMKKRGHDL